CVIPTRVARMGWYFVYPPEGNPQNRFRKDISKSINAPLLEPLSEQCHCMVCQKYTKAYIFHLFKARELLAYKLITYHNLSFYADLMSKIRSSIEDGSLQKLKKEWL